MKKFKWVLIPILISLVYFGGVFLQGRHESPLSTKCYEDSIRISNSRGLWQRLTPAQVIELGQTIADQIVKDIGLQPVTVMQHDFGSNSNTRMTWNRHNRIVRVNLNAFGLSPHKFIRTLGHEILGHAVQDALIAGEDIAISMPDEIVEEWRRNIAGYIRPPLPREYRASNIAARQRFLSYLNQSVEAHANRAGAEFRRQTRQIVVRLPDDIEFKIVFVFAMFAIGGILLKLDADDDAALNFEECILAIYDKEIMSEKPLITLENLHKVLSYELEMKPLGVYISLHGEKKTSYVQVAFDGNCLSSPDCAIAEVAGETWRACNFEFGEDTPADMIDYINGIMSRAYEVVQNESGDMSFINNVPPKKETEEIY